MICFGLDVSKGYCNAGILDDTRNLLLEVFQIDDTKNGHNILESKIEWAAQLIKGDILRVGVESTGGYEKNFLDMLLKLKDKYKLEVYRLNPLSIKKYTEMELHRAKTDDTSAVDIANYLFDMRKQASLEIIKPEIEGLKRLIKLAESETKRETALRNRLQLLIQQTIPELIQFCKDGIPGWILKLLLKYQSVEDIKSLDKTELFKIPYLTDEKAESILELCNNSIGTTTDKATQLTMKMYCKKIIESHEDIHEVKKEVEKLYKNISPNKLTSIYGIGEYSAAVITAYTTNIDRFEDVKQYIAFFGLDPRISDSGDESKRRRITKKGNSVVRKILYTSVLTCLSNENHPVNRQYRRLIKRGVYHFSAVTACMRKLLSIIYGILKTNKEFDINYENKQKTDEQCEKTLSNKKLRIQKNNSLNIEAPISRREYKRRKLVAESYKSTVDLSAGSSTTGENDTINFFKDKEKNMINT
jgi:transposase